jgi:hypothetical protein
MGMILIILAVVMGISVMTAASNSVTTFSVMAPAGPIVPGEQFIVNILVAPGEPLSGVQFDFTFDPSIVQVNDVSQGSLLGQNQADTFFIPGEIDNTAGVISGVVGVILNSGESVANEGTLATINMTALASGPSELRVSQEVAGTVNGQALSSAVNQANIIVNEPPVFNIIGNRTIDEGIPLSFSVKANDADGDALTYSAANLPAGASFDALNRLFTWTPASSQVGTYPDIQFTVRDDNYVVDQTISITVMHINRAPVLEAIANKSVNETALLSFTVNGSDPDGDGLTFSASSLPAGATFNAATRVFSWTPNSTQAGTYSNISFKVSDGLLTASRLMTITVIDVNQAPVLGVIGNKSTKAGVKLSFITSATDADGNKLTYAASNLPKGASFSATSRTFSWTPTATQVGTFSNIRFQVTDGKVSDYELISISVAAPNRAPVMNAISNKSTKTGLLLTFTVSASDANGDALTYSASGLPSGAAFNPATRTFAWTPSASQKGTFKNVKFTVTDGIASAYRSITITVTAGTTSSTTANNKAPTLTSISNKTVKVGKTLSFKISGQDANGDALTYSASNLPAGAVFNPATRTFSWKPASGQVGKYTGVVFTVSDGKLSASRSITITVTK